MAAIPEELRHVVDHAEGSEEMAGLAFHHGVIEGQRAVFVECGIGKVNAAVVATLLATRFDCRALLFGGVAGGLEPALDIGDVVVASALVQHDYGALVEGALRVYKAGVPPLPSIEPRPWAFAVPARLLAELERAVAGLELPAIDLGARGRRRPRLVFGPVATGDTFVDCAATRTRLRAEFDALAVEMEGGAVAQVADRFGLPCVVVRCLSDLAGAGSALDFAAFLPQAARLAALTVRRIVHLL